MPRFYAENNPTIPQIIEEVKARLRNEFRTDNLKWEYVPEWELVIGRIPWRAVEGTICFNLSTTFPEEAHTQIMQACRNHTEHPELAKVTNVTIEGRKIVFIFSPSTP